MSGRERATPLTALGDLLSWIDGLPARELWFRGQPAHWDLKPAVLRRPTETSLRGHAARLIQHLDRIPVEAVKKDYVLGDEMWHLLQSERQLNRDFVRLTASFTDAPATVVEAYFRAQHHRLPTRLLDWTVHPLTALYFAVAPGLENDDGALYALDPVYPVSEKIGTSEYAIAIAAPVVADHDIVLRTVAPLFDAESVEAAYYGDRIQPPRVGAPIPVAPNLAAGRMFAQGSCFTLHPYGCPDFRDGVVEQISIPATGKAGIRAQLRRLGVTHASLFPEADSAVTDIKERWGLP